MNPSTLPTSRQGRVSLMRLSLPVFALALVPAASGQTRGGQNRTRSESRSLAYLPLLPWEVQSQGTDRRTCHPPDGSTIPDYCCSGSISSGGHVSYQPEICALSPDVWRAAERWALDSLTPLPNENDEQCDGCHMVNVLLEHNWTMAFMGDSLTRQTFVGLECDLRRRGYQVTVQTTLRVDMASKAHWRHGLDEIQELHIQRPPDTTAGILHQGTAVIRLYAMYRPMLDMSEVKRYIVDQNDVLVFDHGLHYSVEDNGDDEFRTEMTTLVETLVYDDSPDDTHVERRKRPWKLLAWRETTAQHFATYGGHYVPGMEGWGCPAYSVDQARESNRLTPMVQDILASKQLSQDVTILPLRDYTSQLHELHPAPDCSHYCSSPSLWLPLYRTLRLALDDAVERLRS